MQNYIDLRPYAKSIIDLSPIIWECGYIRNNGGNFSLVPFNGQWLASFRLFGYYIDGYGRSCTHTDIALEKPDEHLFVLLDTDFNFVKRLPVIGNTYWQDPRHQNKTPYLEDMRMVVWNGEIYGSSSIFWQGDKGYIDFGLEV